MRVDKEIVDNKKQMPALIRIAQGLIWGPIGLAFLVWCIALWRTIVLDRCPFPLT